MPTLIWLGLLVLAFVMVYTSSSPTTDQAIRIDTAAPVCNYTQWYTTQACSGTCGHATEVQERFANPPNPACTDLKQVVTCSTANVCGCFWADLKPTLPADAQPCGGQCDNALPGDMCSITCSSGTQSGQTVFPCLPNGEWGYNNAWPPSCGTNLVICPPVVSNMYQSVVVSADNVCVGAQPGDNCQVTCNVGAAPGITSATCLSTGQWSQPVACNAQTCS